MRLLERIYLVQREIVIITNWSSSDPLKIVSCIPLFITPGMVSLTIITYSLRNMPFVDQTGWLIKVGWSALINVIVRLLFEILQI
jgi:hypothetical protein